MFLDFRGRQEHINPTFESKVMIVFVPAVQNSDEFDLLNCLLNYIDVRGKFRVSTQLSYFIKFHNLSRMIRKALIGVVDQ